MSYQVGGVPRVYGPKVQGSERVLSNGAVGAFFENPSGGKNLFKIIQGPPGGRAPAHPISVEEARKAFEKYYNSARLPVYRRGPRKGSPVYKSPSSRQYAMNYDLGHTSRNVVNDSRYLSKRGPALYDFEGVDTGSKVRKPLSQAATAARLARLEKGRATVARNRAARKGQLAGAQQGGWWW